MSKQKNEPSAQPESAKQGIGKPNETLKKIAAEAGITPKAARRKLRKAWRSKDSAISHTLKARWDDAAAIRTVLIPTKQ